MIPLKLLMLMIKLCPRVCPYVTLTVASFPLLSVAVSEIPSYLTSLWQLLMLMLLTLVVSMYPIMSRFPFVLLVVNMPLLKSFLVLLKCRCRKLLVSLRQQALRFLRLRAFLMTLFLMLLRMFRVRLFLLVVFYRVPVSTFCVIMRPLWDTLLTLLIVTRYWAFLRIPVLMLLSLRLRPLVRFLVP